ncbi:MAG TPA: formate dehydrogenase accessory sulfurtransferase FdhD [Caulobacteraceae bacterium]|nr:formate dehydrogenase accessory sulfurtransferase FdhD [Caulobacteraceae bacterium]
MPEPPATAVRLAAEAWREAGAPQALERPAPEEAAVGLAYDSRPYVVVMATPADVEDLAVGFTVTERVARFADIEQIAVQVADEGLIADVLLAPGAGDALAQTRRRTLEARSSCGLCGVETLQQAMRPVTPVGPGPRITHAAIQRAVAAMEAGQPLGRLTRATHAAAWALADGEVALVREDVGRHNALDKVIGAGLRAGLDPVQAFVVVTSRCSYEMVEKAAAAGVAVLVAVSAPTALAIRKAKAAGMTLVALARADGHEIYCGQERIVAA